MSSTTLVLSRASKFKLLVQFFTRYLVEVKVSQLFAQACYCMTCMSAWVASKSWHVKQYDNKCKDSNTNIEVPSGSDALLIVQR
jgi:hypothetical protein